MNQFKAPCTFFWLKNNIFPVYMYVPFCFIQMNAYIFGFIEIKATEQLIKWNTLYVGFGFGNTYLSTTDTNLYFYFRFQSKIVCVLWRSLQVNCIIDRPWTPYCSFRVFFLCLSCSFSFLCIKETWWPLCSISGTAFYRTRTLSEILCDQHVPYW